MKRKNYISSTILGFHSKNVHDDNHRYKSWEHCYAYFCQEDLELDVGCLQLAFYLASWGMYRGSSFLLWKDYLIHEEVVSHLLSNRHLQGVGIMDEDTREEVFKLIEWVKKWYQNNIKLLNGKEQTINVTDTLATKIILGSLGCVPAYDRYFVAGIRREKLRYSKLRLKNLTDVVRYYEENHEQFSLANQSILDQSGVDYPPMKLVDMYFWSIGFEAP